MKIKVQRCDGDIETINLIEPLTIVRGETINQISCGTGCDYFFTAEGKYEGWGGAVNFDSEKEAALYVNAVEADREIEPAAAPTEREP